MKKNIKEWQEECLKFQEWFTNLGGNISNKEQMKEAFSRIEYKKKSDNKLFELLEKDYINKIEVVYEQIKI